MTFVLVLLSGFFLHAAEPDNCSARAVGDDVPVANAVINRVVNGVLDLALQDFNPAKQDGCSREKFLKFIDDDFDRNLPNITSAIYKLAPIAGPRFYGEVPYGKGLPYTDLYFSQSYKVQAHGRTFYIGLDKLDHIFSHGAVYWEVVGKDPTLPKDKVKKALALGVAQENASWGLQNTQVKSYADLVANYQGLFFWRDLFSGTPPIVICKDGRFVKNREFEITDYLDEAMDECINCNSYATEATLKKIKSVNDARGISCPVAKDSCALSKARFADLSPTLLHPLCLGTGTAQVEKASPQTVRDVLNTVQGAISGGPDYLHFKLFVEKKRRGVQ